MERRTHESPMDFEWQTQGPADVTSPFYQLSQKHPRKRGFESPIKELTTPSNTKSSFGAPSTSTAAPFRNPSFTTPRKSFDAEPFSEASGIDSSPADNADVDTPEVDHKSKAVTSFTSGMEKKPLFSRFGANSSSHTPGRGTILRGNNDAIARRVRKRRRAERDKVLLFGRRYNSESDSDDGEVGADHGRERRGNQNLPPQQGTLASILTFIASKPTLPYILSYYPQLIFNLFISLFGIYLLISFYFAVQAEVNRESVIAAGAVIAEMAQCAAKYTENKCAPNTRLPALETACQSWEACMNRDPEMVGRAKISARTFAEIFNNFIEPISWKAMLFVVILVVVAIVAPNLSFGFYRSRANHPPPAPTPGPQHHYYAPTPGAPHYQDNHWPMPQTPYHHSSQQITDFGIEVPFKSIMPSQTPSQSSPRKRNRH